MHPLFAVISLTLGYSAFPRKGVSLRRRPFLQGIKPRGRLAS